MRCHRRGTDLDIQIRLELLALGKNYREYDGRKLKIAEKVDYLKSLRKERENAGTV